MNKNFSDEELRRLAGALFARSAAEGKKAGGGRRTNAEQGPMPTALTACLHILQL